MILTSALSTSPHSASGRMVIVQGQLDATTIDELRALGEDDPSFLCDLVDQYLNDTDPRIAGLEDAARKGEMRTLRSLAHLVRGSSANLGAIEMTEACRAVEQLDPNVEPAACEMAVRDVRAAWDRVLPLLEALAIPAGASGA